MTCHMCGGRIVEKEITYHTMFRDKLIVVENVPALECIQCAERYFSSESSKRLEEIVWEQDEPFQLVKVPVFDFAKSKVDTGQGNGRVEARGD